MILVTLVVTACMIFSGYDKCNDMYRQLVSHDMSFFVLFFFVFFFSFFYFFFFFFLFLFFFFQAEDGIRDTSVTGVQTCALPIFINYHIKLNKIISFVTNILLSFFILKLAIAIPKTIGCNLLSFAIA